MTVLRKPHGFSLDARSSDPDHRRPVLMPDLERRSTALRSSSVS